MSDRFAFIGAGALAGAVTECLAVYYGSGSKKEFILYDPDKSKYDNYAGKNYSVSDTINDAVAAGRYIVLAVKPQNLSAVLAEIKAGNCYDESVFILPAAGVATVAVTDILGDVPVIRIMPNMPLRIGYGVTAICRNAAVSDDDYKIVFDVFSACGYTFELPEEGMNPVIAATSSSPAYVYLFIKSIIDGSASMGLDPRVMLEPACRAVIGSAYMLLRSGKTPEELISMVATPGGTTESALSVLTSNGFVETVGEAMRSCTKRANELSVI